MFKTAIGILVISNHNSFECCLIKLLPCILFEKYTYILALELASPGNQHCASCISTLSIVPYTQTGTVFIDLTPSKSVSKQLHH